MAHEAHTTDVDPAAYLDSPEMIAAYLNEVLGENDPSALAEALGHVARARGMSDLAQQAGLSRSALYRALSAKGATQLDTIMRVLAAMGYGLRVAPSGGAKAA